MLKNISKLLVLLAVIQGTNVNSAQPNKSNDTQDITNELSNKDLSTVKVMVNSNNSSFDYGENSFLGKKKKNNKEEKNNEENENNEENIKKENFIRKLLKASEEARYMSLENFENELEQKKNLEEQLDPDTKVNILIRDKLELRKKLLETKINILDDIISYNIDDISIEQIKLNLKEMLNSNDLKLEEEKNNEENENNEENIKKENFIRKLLKASEEARYMSLENFENELEQAKKLEELLDPDTKVNILIGGKLKLIKKLLETEINILDDIINYNIDNISIEQIKLNLKEMLDSNDLKLEEEKESLENLKKKRYRKYNKRLKLQIQIEQEKEFLDEEFKKENKDFEKLDREFKEINSSVNDKQNIVDSLKRKSNQLEYILSSELIQ